MSKHYRVPLLLAIAATAAFLVAPAVSYAQSAPAAAPAKNLKDVAPIPGVAKLTLTNPVGDSIHILPTVAHAAARQRAMDAVGYSDIGPLLYHAGGSIMTPNIQFYIIYWIPAHLQTGAATSMSLGYRAVQTNLISGYGGHSLSAINTQYYQTISSRTTYINGNGSLAIGGTVVDTAAYPASGCTDSATPGNCITEAQVKAKIQSVMAAKGWTGGMNKLFLLFTSKGEGSCFDSSNAQCAYVQYCAYHGFISGSPNIVFGYIPYGNNSVCKGSQNSPNSASSPEADAASTGLSHEISEAITDPLLNAWFTASGNENGDLCAYNYGTRTYDGGLANQQWNGHFFDVQLEYSNHQNSVSAGTGCVLHGP